MQSIKVNEKTYSFCWGMLTFMNTCDKLGISLADLHEKIALDDAKCWYNLAYQALITNDITFNNSLDVSGDELESLSFAQFMHWLDNEPQETGDAISESYRKSMYMGKTMEQRYSEILERLNIEIEGLDANKKPVKKKKDLLVK